MEDEMDREKKVREWKIAFAKAKIDYSVTEEKCMVWLKIPMPYTVIVDEKEIENTDLNDLLGIFGNLNKVYDFLNVLNHYFNVLELAGKFNTRDKDQFQFLRNEIILTMKNHPEFFDSKFNVKFLEGLDYLKSLGNQS